MQKVKHVIPFIHKLVVCVSGNYFADFGDKFIYNDTNDEEPFEGSLIEKITC